MRLILFSIVSLALFGSAKADTVVVNPNNMDGWNFYKTSGDPNYTYGQGDATAQMVFGPSVPPLGVGSANFNTGSDGSQSAQLRNSDWAGTAISSLTSLSYSTYAAAWNGQQLPYMTIYLSNGDRLQFEPAYSGTSFGGSQPDPALNTWQTWDALNGKWYTDQHFGEGSNAVSWSQVLTAEGSATIVNDAGNGDIGGIRIASGFASAENSFDTNLDNFTIGVNGNNTTYDFEPVPETSTVIAGSLAAALLIVQILRSHRFGKNNSEAGA